MWGTCEQLCTTPSSSVAGRQPAQSSSGSGMPSPERATQVGSPSGVQTLIAPPFTVAAQYKPSSGDNPQTSGSEHRHSPPLAAHSPSVSPYARCALTAIAPTVIVCAASPFAGMWQIATLSAAPATNGVDAM